MIGIEESDGARLEGSGEAGLDVLVTVVRGE